MIPRALQVQRRFRMNKTGVYETGAAAVQRLSDPRMRYARIVKATGMKIE
jgi:hypothetical protein